MTDPTDIVTTLRRESFYRPTSRINSDGKAQLGFELMSLNLDAANEIERLRKELDARIAMCDMRSEKIGELTNERDEARREICKNVTAISASMNAEQWARERGWDCFKKKTLKDCFKENTNV